VPNMPPNKDAILTSEDANVIAEQMRHGLILLSDYCSNLSIATHPRLVEGLREQGLDAGSTWSNLIYGGDASRTAKRILDPLKVISQETYNAAQSATLFKRRFEQMYSEPIRRAIAERQRGGQKSIKVV